MRKRKLLAVLTVTLSVLVAAGVFVLWPRTGPDLLVTRKNAELVLLGDEMTLTDAKAIFRCEPGDYRT
jgi:hypothetical protein